VTITGHFCPVLNNEILHSLPKIFLRVIYLFIYCLFHNASFMLCALLQIISELGTKRGAAGHRMCKNFRRYPQMS